MKRQRKNTKNIMNKMVVAILILAITGIIYISYLLLGEQDVSYASTQDKQVSYETINPVSINMQEIIQQNTTKAKKEEIIKEEVDLEYLTTYIEDPSLPKGMLQVLQEGTVGKQEIITKKTYEGEKLVKEEQTGSQVVKAATNKIVSIGTGNYRGGSTNAEIGDKLYVTPDLLAVRIQANDQAEKLITLKQDNEVTLLQKQEEWYQVKYQSYIGWAKAECFTTLEPNQAQEDQTEVENASTYTKEQLLNTLSFDMKLNKPSGLSLEQFKKIFANDSNDTKKVFQNNAQYFYYAEKQYNVNGVFLAAVAIHESGWGGSSIASDKNNLFGYGAYDSSPYDSAYEFSDYSEGIDLLARVFAKYYLNPEGTEIYDGNKADGCYYHGATLTGVNTKYATDKNWANGVYYWMKYLYNRI